MKSVARRTVSLAGVAGAGLLCLLAGLTVPGCGDGGSVLGGERGPTRFRFPANDPAGSLFIPEIVFHVDHDAIPAEGLLSQIQCTNFEGNGFPQCYGDHDGSDFLLRGGFRTMDSGSAEVVAAASGVVVELEDGNYDRCHASIAALASGGISCDGNPMAPNFVKIRHRDGVASEYLHLMSGSIRVAVGEEVGCGEVLGLVGSSGKSAMPHVHFEVHGAEGELLDPFAGPYSQPESLWVEQDGPTGLPGQKCEAG